MDLVEQGLYKPVGIECNDCGFVTKKKGFSGRQALRAHSKRHRYDERAWRGPLLLQGLVAGSIMALVIIGLAGSAELKVEVHSMLPSTAPIEMIPTAIIGWGTVAISVGLFLASWLMLSVPGEDGGQPLVRVLSGLRVAGSLMGLWVIVATWGVVSPALSWSMLAPALLMIALTPVLAAKVGVVRLVVKRRGVKSASYSNLVSPKDALAGAEALLWWKSRQAKTAPARK